MVWHNQLINVGYRLVESNYSLSSCSLVLLCYVIQTLEF